MLAITLMLTLSLFVSLALTISQPVHDGYRPLITVGGGRWWSGVVGGDFSQTDLSVLVICGYAYVYSLLRY